MEHLETAAIERLQASTGGRFKSIISLFIINVEENLQELESSVISGDAEVAIRVAHSLRRATSQLGASRLSEIMKIIECRAKERKLDDIKARMGQIRREFANIRHALDNLA